MCRLTYRPEKGIELPAVCITDMTVRELLLGLGTAQHSSGKAAVLKCPWHL